MYVGNLAAEPCNVYTGTDLNQPQTKFGCGTSPPTLDGAWCPSSRKVNQSQANGGPPDYIGVYVKLQHKYYTRLFGTSADLTGQTVIQIEPRSL